MSNTQIGDGGVEYGDAERAEQQEGRAGEYEISDDPGYFTSYC